MTLVQPGSGLSCDQVNDNLEQLTGADVKIALDDFGSGSSFRLLHWLPIPISALKIGRDDVARMHTPTGSAVLHAVTDLSRRLNVPVVAVGVETAVQRRTLWEAGCTSGQGTALGGTMPNNNLVQALQRGALTSVLHEGADVIPLRSTAPGR
jgi:EAL domain-containing protein (putative c-di-GMP-specific phosphodiesterase class I)